MTYNREALIKALRKTSNRLSLGFVFGCIIYALFYRYVNDFMITNNLLSSIVSIFLFFTMYFITLSISDKDVLSLKKPKNHSLVFVLLGLIVNFLANIISTVVSYLFSLWQVSSPQPDSLFKHSNTKFGVLIYFLSVAIIPAIFEELICRGLVLGLLKKFGDGFAIITSAIFFALIHGNIEQGVFAFIIGLYYALVVIKTSSIFPAIFLHFLNNFLVALAKILNDSAKFNFNFERAYSVFLIVSNLIILMTVYSYVKKKNIKIFYLKSLRNKKKALTIRDKITSLILTPGALLFILFCTYSFISSIKTGS